jgi:hypothetical protein
MFWLTLQWSVSNKTEFTHLSNDRVGGSKGERTGSFTGSASAERALTLWGWPDLTGRATDSSSECVLARTLYLGKAGKSFNCSLIR